MIILIIEYFTALCLNLKYAKGITVKTSTTKIHTTIFKYFTSICKNSDMFNLNMLKKDIKIMEVNTIEIADVLNTSSLFFSEL